MSKKRANHIPADDASRIQEFDDVAVEVPPGTTVRPERRVGAILERERPDGYPIWQTLSEEFERATAHDDKFRAVRRFYESLVARGKVYHASAPPEPTHTCATGLAMRVGSVLAQYPELRALFQRLVGGIEICCKQSDRIYDIVGDVVHFYGTPASLTDDEIVAVTLRMLGRLMYRTAPRDRQAEYERLFSGEGPLITGAVKAEDEIASLVATLWLERRTEREHLRQISGRRFDARSKWVSTMLSEWGHPLVEPTRQ